MSLAGVLALGALPMSVLCAPLTVTGKVVNGAGDGVPHAEVWAIRTRYEYAAESTLAGSTKADEEGDFAIPGIEFDPDAGLLSPRETLTVATHGKGLALGWLAVGKMAAGLEIVCPAPRRATGRATTRGGEGIPSRLGPTLLWRQDKPPVILPDELKERLTVSARADGRFAIDWLPDQCLVALTFEAPGYGRVRLWSDFDTPQKIVLDAASSIRGRVTCEQDLKAVAELELTAAGNDGTGRLSWAGIATTDAQGRFEIADLPPEHTTVSLRFKADAEWRAAAQEVELKAGETTEITFRLEQACLLTGRVVDEDTGEPIQGVAIAVSGAGGSVRTDEDGCYSLRALPGSRTVDVRTTPEPYVQGRYDQDRRSVQVIDGDVALPDFALKRGVTIEGSVLGSQGRPVPGAQVFSTAGGHGFLVAAHVDEDGRFKLSRLDPEKKIEVRAREGERLTAAPVSVDPKTAEQIKLVVEEGVGVKLRVRVLNDEGTPIARAKVTAMWRRERFAGTASAGRTDADGRWESDSQWPDGSYELTITAPGCPRVRTEKWAAVARQTHDFGDVVLTKARGVVAGRVVDADGKPVPDADVYNRGDGATALESRTDRDGRFRLEGLFPGHAYVFAEKGDLFGGARVSVGSEDAVITVTPDPASVKLGEPGKAVSFTTPETDRKIAEQLIHEALDMPMGKYEGYYRHQLIGSLALCNLDEALDISAAQGGKYNDHIYWTLGSDTLADDPEQGLAYLANIGSVLRRTATMVFAAQRLASVAPELAKGLCDDAIIESQTMPGTASQAQQTAYRSLAAEALYKVDPEAGEEAIREAASLAQDLGFAGYDAFARGCAAEALCHIDLDGALELLQGITGEDESRRHQPNIAARIAATQPDRVAQLMTGLPDWQRGNKMARVVYNMAPAHPDKAIALARTVKRSGARARALGLIAVALRDKTPERALRAFEEAMQTVRTAKPERHEQPERSAVMAELAQIALQIGYPGEERLAWRAISLRPAPSQESWGYQYGSGQYIKKLAFAAPALARDLVRDARDLKPGKWRRPSDRLGTLVTAAALVDANLAAEILRALPDDEPGEERPNKPRLYATAAEFLLLSPQRRYVKGMAGTYWAPGAEHAD